MKSRWIHTVSQLSVGRSKEPPDKSFEEIRTRYSEKHRFYHNLDHIARCLALFDQIQVHAADPLSLELAVWLHDSMYDTESSDNEERSAEFACSLLSTVNLPEVRLKNIETLILATKHFGEREETTAGGIRSADSVYIQDIDLSILGAASEKYKAYVEAVRKEYAHYSDEQFNEGRLKVVAAFLRKKRIYRTEYFFSRFEAQARENLSREQGNRSAHDPGVC